MAMSPEAEKAVEDIWKEINGLRTLVDFVDVDSAKWSQYAPNHRWPLSWLYRREGERLLSKILPGEFVVCLAHLGRESEVIVDFAEGWPNEGNALTFL